MAIFLCVSLVSAGLQASMYAIKTWTSFPPLQNGTYYSKQFIQICAVNQRRIFDHAQKEMRPYMIVFYHYMECETHHTSVAKDILYLMQEVCLDVAFGG